MGKRVVQQVTYIDDFDDQEVDEGLLQTIEFSWEGSAYTIDLRPQNADKFRKDIDKWVAAATKITGKRGRPARAGGGGSTRPGTGSGRSKEELANIREWLVKNNHEVSPSGRIKAELLDIYDEAHK